jgi:hypothetical protein
MEQGTRARRLHASGTEPVTQPQHALSGAQALQDVIGQQPLPAELGSYNYAGNARFVREAESLFHPEREPLIN